MKMSVSRFNEPTMTRQLRKTKFFFMEIYKGRLHVQPAGSYW